MTGAPSPWCHEPSMSPPLATLRQMESTQSSHDAPVAATAEKLSPVTADVINTTRMRIVIYIFRFELPLIVLAGVHKIFSDCMDYTAPSVFECRCCHRRTFQFVKLNIRYFSSSHSISTTCRIRSDDHSSDSIPHNWDSAIEYRAPTALNTGFVPLSQRWHHVIELNLKRIYAWSGRGTAALSQFDVCIWRSRK